MTQTTRDTTHRTTPARRTAGALLVVPFKHPQGCRSYLVVDPVSRQALALDVHLDLAADVAQRVRDEGWALPYVIDSHTHADHPSGASALAAEFSSTRIAHAAGRHQGVARHPAHGDTLHLGDVPVSIRHAPGHTPDHLVLVTDGALFSGDTLLIGAIARTDFLGGDAGQLFDTLHGLLDELADDTVVYPGHDYAGRTSTTIGAERGDNPWLAISDRAAFVQQLTANPPPRPANMDALLQLNRDGVDVPPALAATDVVARVAAGGAGSVIDVRTAFEVAGEHVPGARHVELADIASRVDDVRATPAPRLLLCQSGSRAEQARVALAKLGVGGLSVITGGIVAYRAAGGETVIGRATISLERQVRIAAGALVLIGVVLGSFVHPAFFGLSAFVGAGLVFAGITDTCGMGMMMAKAPWNSAQEVPAPAAASGGTCAATPPASGGCAATPPASGGCAAAPPPRS